MMAPGAYLVLLAFGGPRFHALPSVFAVPAAAVRVVTVVPPRPLPGVVVVLLGWTSSCEGGQLRLRLGRFRIP